MVEEKYGSLFYYKDEQIVLALYESIRGLLDLTQVRLD